MGRIDRRQSEEVIGKTAAYQLPFPKVAHECSVALGGRIIYSFYYYGNYT